MGSSEPGLHFDHGGEALFEILKGNIVVWACYPQRMLEPMKPPILAIVGYPPEFHCRSEQPGIGLNCRFYCFSSPMAGFATSSAAEERCLSPTSPD